MFKCVTLTTLVIIWFGSSTAVPYRGCPPGKCIPLSECREVNLLVTNQTFDTYGVDFICGYGAEPHVCCQRHCITRNGNNGQCVRLEHCPALEKALTNPVKEKFVINSMCAYGSGPYVCCNAAEDHYDRKLPPPKDLYNTEDCITPNGDFGKCLNLQLCRDLEKIAQIETDENFGFVNDSQCGWTHQPQVCCGQWTNYTEMYKHKLPTECGKWDNRTVVAPWLAVINSGSSNCLGALINNRYIITSASCLGNLTNLDIRIGSCITNLTDKSCRIKKGEAKIFPLYNYLRQKVQNVALLRLNNNFTTSNFVCLPEHELFSNARVEIVEMENDVILPTGSGFRTVRVDECQKELPTVTNGEICVEIVACKNNSNSKLLLSNVSNRWYFQGIVTETCSNNTERFLNIFKYMPWIRSNIR